MTNVKTVSINGKELKCMYCGHNMFWQAETLLNQKWLSIFNQEAWGKSGKAFICDKCGYKHEFISKKGIF